MLVAAKNFSQITKKDNIKFLSVSPSNHYKPFGTVVLSEDSLYQEHALIGNERDEDHFAHPLGFNFSGFCGGCNILKLNPPANYKALGDIISKGTVPPESYLCVQIDLLKETTVERVARNMYRVIPDEGSNDNYFIYSNEKPRIAYTLNLAVIQTLIGKEAIPASPSPVKIRDINPTEMIRNTDNHLKSKMAKLELENENLYNKVLQLNGQIKGELSPKVKKSLIDKDNEISALTKSKSDLESKLSGMNHLQEELSSIKNEMSKLKESYSTLEKQVEEEKKEKENCQIHVKAGEEKIKELKSTIKTLQDTHEIEIRRKDEEKEELLKINASLKSKNEEGNNFNNITIMKLENQLQLSAEKVEQLEMTIANSKDKEREMKNLYDINLDLERQMKSITLKKDEEVYQLYNQIEIIRQELNECRKEKNELSIALSDSKLKNNSNNNELNNLKQIIENQRIELELKSKNEQISKKDALEKIELEHRIEIILQQNELLKEENQQLQLQNESFQQKDALIEQLQFMLSEQRSRTQFEIEDLKNQLEISKNEKQSQQVNVPQYNPNPNPHPNPNPNPNLNIENPNTPRLNNTTKSRIGPNTRRPTRNFLRNRPGSNIPTNQNDSTNNDQIPTLPSTQSKVNPIALEASQKVLRKTNSKFL